MSAVNYWKWKLNVEGRFVQQRRRKLARSRLLNIYRELNSQCLFCFTDNSPAICHNLFLILALIWSQPVHSRGITTLGLSAVLPQFRAFWLHELFGKCEGEMGVELYTSIYTRGKCI